MNRKVFGGALCAVLLVLSVSVEAQQPAAKVPRIGFLTTGGEAASALRVEAFRQGLRELGYVEGKNIIIEYRYAEGRFERLPELADELVRLKVDVLVVSSITVARPARKVTATIPIVVAGAGDPIGSGLVASLARPGGNVTGLYQFSPELLGKRLELLKEVVPKVSRFAFLNDADAAASKSMFQGAQDAAKALGVKFQLVEVKAPNPDLEGAFRVMVKERIGALITEATPLTQFHRKKILELVEQNHIPAMHAEQEWANAGGLMSYGANRVDLYRRAATYVDKILKGAKPAELPVEQPTKFELVINLKTAKALNMTIPQSVLFRADKVIR
jgi:putative ABC transport system substrate-binding protein